MHCLGAISGAAGASMSPPSQNVNGSVLSVIRALGVLVCEGRIQGPPRGYREGPHCAAPLQASPTQHTCDKQHYLCNRYLVLVKEIIERVSIGSSLCIEVVMCNDCPCGLSTATSTNPVSPIPSTLIHQWPNTEMLLEYWCIGVVPSKNSEMMNSQGLYQAVRSRLHFSQVAAWWSRSNGSRPTYVATRVVPYNSDNLRKFRDAPVEHTFPLASIGDGNSVKVSVWALPRMEDIPDLKCPLHPSGETKEETARALTPTKTTVAHPDHTLVLPALLDDRLHTPCNKPGKHHCRCEEEETSPPSPSIKNGERKRRRSLPCGPPDTQANAQPLASVSEVTTGPSGGEEGGFERSFGGNGSLEKYFWTQVSLDEPDGNIEKRYKPSAEGSNIDLKADKGVSPHRKDLKPQSFVPLDPKELHKSSPHRSPLSSLPNLVINPFSERSSFHEPNPGPSTLRKDLPSLPCTVHLNYSSSFRKPERVYYSVDRAKAPSDLTHLMSKLSFPKEPTKTSKEDGGILDWITRVPGRVLNPTPIPSVSDKPQEMSPPSQHDNGRACSAVKLKNCNLELSQREFDEVLAVLRARTPSGRRRTPVKTLRRRERLERTLDDGYCDKSEGCMCPIHKYMEGTSNAGENCECRSCRKSMINEDVKIGRSREKCLESVSNKADVLLGAILRTSGDRKRLVDISNGTRPRASSSHLKDIISEEQVITTDVRSQRPRMEEEKSLPMALNRRLQRIQQLFRKVQEKKNSIEMASGFQEIINQSRFAQKRDKGDKEEKEDKREVKEKKEEKESGRVGVDLEGKPEHIMDDEPGSGDSAFSNSTNYVFRDFSNHHEASERAISSTVGAEEEDDVEEEIRKIQDTRGEEEGCESRVPSAFEQERFRRSLENAASMVFHSRTGLPLTSSPAPLRRGSCCFDYDSSLNTVSSKRSALFELNTPPSPGAVSLEETDREIDHSGEGYEQPKRSPSTRNRPQSHALLGSFEESALNGRLEPVSTVHGFTAEIGASGSFCPKHRKLPVTVFFYTLGDNDKVSSPYLAHINLGKKGYQVPRSGTIQVTLLNPLGTVVKMFVVLYDLSDMPPRSHTFLRQRTLRDKSLRYLIHLRFMSGKSGRVYLHTDIRMIICHKSDVDTASDFGSEPPKEYRSYIHGPTNPKFSPRC
ncbi:protein FAM214A [Fopius arisanus]|uniref:Protein FAM214A n=2 Tax=Fopius arisanus TaxID=64838 RepID=A0A9R1U6P2_9HYME|nr:PREDICTED: protein FAM214A [Fopius arisanus]XP_011309221.1 PREDICTED: protein FAM214A [Fopius arisanus]XP_011309222.1 PREDICTED: protein FAM214A [Fopius arisanus]XP_011309223.1 PREDICTED: protein FAM214A [Fopius arisanus]XP_011309224.1 PREDICTED: protein FAM214A [Fopius arisanus]